MYLHLTVLAASVMVHFRMDLAAKAGHVSQF